MPITVRVRSPDDFPAAAAALSAQVYSSHPQPVEIILEAGVYVGADLRLDASDQPLPVTVRAEGEVWFEDSSLDINAGPIVVSGLRFRGQRGFYFLQLSADGPLRADNITFQGAQVTPQRRGSATRGALASVEGLSAGEPMDLSGWTLDDVHVPGASLVYLWSSGARLGTVTLAGWQVANAEAAIVLNAASIEQIRLLDCWIQAPPGATLLHAPHTPSPPEVRGCHLLADVLVSGTTLAPTDSRVLTRGQDAEAEAIDAALARPGGPIRTRWPE